MTPELPPLRLTGAEILHDGRLSRGALSLAGGRVVEDQDTRSFREVDLTGALLLPGIVDLHGDSFERHVAPRPGRSLPLTLALAATDREAAAQGITTAWLAQGWSWEGGLRGPDGAEALLDALAAYRPRALIDLRAQIRIETHLFDHDDRLIAALARHEVGFAVFNDHLAQGLQAVRRGGPEIAAWARANGQDEAAFMASLNAARARCAEVPRRLLRLARAFDALGLHFASHDDPDGTTRDYYHALGARIAEFPLSRGAARVAKTLGGSVLMGAPNLMRGGSHKGNVSARDLIAEGLVDALVSDYALPCLAAAPWAIADAGLAPLAQAWEAISTRPAKLLGLGDRGALLPGRRADLVVVNPATRTVEATIAGGRLAHLSGETGARLLGGLPGLRIAAE